MASKDASPDTSVDLKKSARRRLVGAIALALLAVIVLPMVMDHEPGPAAQDIQIRIPDQGTDRFATHVAAGKSAASAAVALPKADIAIGKPDDKPNGSSEAESGQSASAETLQHEIKPSSQADAQRPATMRAGDKLVTDKVIRAPAAEEAHAAAVLNGDGDRWLVRLGAYQNATNVKQLLAKVKETGVQAYSEKFDSPKGPRTRVMAGPFNSREAADKAQAKIKRLGVDGTVIAKQ